MLLQRQITCDGLLELIYTYERIRDGEKLYIAMVIDEIQENTQFHMDLLEQGLVNIRKKYGDDIKDVVA